MRIYDISTEISQDMPVYDALEKIHITEIYQIKNGDPCNLTQFNMIGHIGTHADMPLHFIEGGMACDNIPLDHFYGETKVYQMPPSADDITKDDLLPLDIQAGNILLLNTGKKALTPEAAIYLTEKKIKTLGVDSLSVDPFDSQDYPAHHILLGKGIPILEGLVLDGISQGKYELSALPLKIKNGNGSPVRAILSDRHDVKLVIFDMDGLMIDTEPLSKEGWLKALTHYGLEMSESLFSQMIGRNIVTAQELMCSHYGPDFDFEAVRKIRTNYMEDQIQQNGLSMKKGLIYILDRLDQLGIKKCVATSTEWDSMRKKLGQLNLLSRFDGFVAGDQVKVGKPHPDIFLKAAKLIGIDPANCVVLEDSMAGIAAAYSARMRPIAIPDIAPLNRIAVGQIYAQCNDLEEATEIIARLRS